MARGAQRQEVVSACSRGLRNPAVAQVRTLENSEDPHDQFDDRHHLALSALQRQRKQLDLATKKRFELVKELQNTLDAMDDGLDRFLPTQQLPFVDPQTTDLLSMPVLTILSDSESQQYLGLASFMMPPASTCTTSGF